MYDNPINVNDITLQCGTTIQKWNLGKCRYVHIECVEQGLTETIYAKIRYNHRGPIPTTTTMENYSEGESDGMSKEDCEALGFPNMELFFSASGTNAKIRIVWY
jgi:hypothetical protein